MTDTPKRTLSERIRVAGDVAYVVGGGMEGRRLLRQYADEVAALEQERDEWARRWDRSQEDNARLRKAIREIDEAILGPEPTAPRVREILHALTEGENDGRD